MELSGHM